MSVSFYITSSGKECMNMANGNAFAILSLVGITGEDVYYGDLAVDSIPEMQRRALRALNQEDAVDSATSESTVESRTRVEGDSIVRGPTVYTMGRDAEYVRRRLTDFLQMLKEAQAENSGIHWG